VIVFFSGFRLIILLCYYRLDQKVLPWFCAPSFYMSWLILYPVWGKGPSLGERLKYFLIHAGPIFIKFGQVWVTRTDVLKNTTVIKALDELTDSMPAVDSNKIVQIIEATYQCSIGSIFEEFSMKPLASASIAQVHAAVYQGNSVVVKVLRPNIHRKVQRNLDLLTLCAQFMHCFKRFKSARLLEVAKEFCLITKKELNLKGEAANASQLKRNLSGESDVVQVPKMFFHLVKENILVAEYIGNSIKCNDIEALDRAHVDKAQLARNGVMIFLAQVFRDRFFHADMHPGNVGINIDNPDHPYFVLFDFGIMGSITPFDQRYIIDNLLAFIKKDYQKVAALHIESGWVPENVRLDHFESAVRSVCEPIYALPLREVSFARLFIELFHVAQSFQLINQPQLLMLQKTLFMVERLGASIDGEMNLWETAEPYLERWLKEQTSIPTFLKKIKNNLPYWFEKLPQVQNALLSQWDNARSVQPLYRTDFADQGKRTTQWWLWRFVLLCGKVLIASIIVLCCSWLILLFLAYGSGGA
jgi:ubiquinone biosynthesis protein